MVNVVSLCVYLIGIPVTCLICFLVDLRRYKLKCPDITYEQFIKDLSRDTECEYPGAYLCWGVMWPVVVVWFIVAGIGLSVDKLLSWLFQKVS